MVFRKQVEQLLEKLRDNSDEESYDDEKEAALNVEKAMLVD